MGAFMDELNQWIRNGYRIAHVSVTRSHSNDRRVRYIYGIVDTIQQTGVLTKIIQRLELGSDHLSKEVGIRTFQYLGLD
jgi:hypothetical protein